MKKPCSIYEIKNENGRISYKIFTDNEDMQIYLKRNKGKVCEKKKPVFLVEEYKEYAGTQVRKLTSDKIKKYMAEQKDEQFSEEMFRFEKRMKQADSDLWRFEK